jgi:outer membrane protein OmpA-like peptidoglycan-associated protein
MKRTILLSLVCCLVAGGLFAQENATQTKPSEWTRWSVYIDGGIDVPKASEGDFLRRKYYDPEFGIGVERTFNSLFGLGLDYMYMRQTNEVYKARVNQLNVTVPLNMSNLLSPCRSWQKLNIYFVPGLGIGFSGHNSFSYNGVDYESLKTESSLGMQIGLKAEYDISSHFAIGLDGQYRWTSNMRHAPKLDVGNKYGDYGYYGVNLSVRYKFAGKDNIRNTNQIFAERCRPVINYEDRLMRLENELEDLKQKAIRDSLRGKADEDSLAALKDKVAVLKADNEKALAAIKKMETAGGTTFAAPVKINLSNIYYKLNRYTLTSDANSILDKVAEFMQKNPDAKLEIASYTDNRGSDAYNVKLSKKRTQSVVNYLTSKGVAKDRIKATGNGKADSACTKGEKCTEKEYALDRYTEITILNTTNNTVVGSVK